MDYITKSLLKFTLGVLLTPMVFAGDNHVHVEQVADGDNVNLNISQIGHGNTINFSFAHQNNTWNIQQIGTGNSVSWVSYWGSGKAWGGDVDGTGNIENIIQKNGATYGRHIWGNNNDVDIYQDGGHEHNIDIHVDGVEHESWQEGTGTHYSHTYFYQGADDSETSLMQKGSGNHNAQIRLQGTEHTILNLLQQGSTNQSYTLTQTCYTVGGCAVNVTQGN